MRKACVAIVAAGALTVMMPTAGRAANARDHLESQRISAIVYVGLVPEDQTIVARDRGLPLNAEARVQVLGIAKGPEKAPATARLRYPSWDERTAPREGSPLYRLTKGTYVVAFVSSFDDRPAYLIAGTKDEVREFTQKLRDGLANMTAAHLKFHEISEAARAPQLAVYDKVLELLK